MSNPHRLLMILIALVAATALAALPACRGGGDDDDDDASGDDDTGDDDTGDDDTGDDDTGDDDDASCGGLAPPGYAGDNGFHVVTDEEADIVVDNVPYESYISSISSGLFISLDQPAVVGEDYIWITLQASPHSTVSSGPQDLQPTPDGGPALTYNFVPDYPNGVNDQRTYAINGAFSASSGTITCDQAPSAGAAFHCTFDATLVWAEQDEDTGDLYLAGCAAMSGAFSVVLGST